MGKKQKPNTPRRKRFNQQTRLQNAKTWIPKYAGRNIVRGYSKWFGVDLLCAMKELEMIGHQIDEIYKEQVMRSLEARQLHRKKQKEKKRNVPDVQWPMGDETFYFIAGYTSNGVPFGITHEEMEKEERSIEDPYQIIDDDELPF